MLASLMFDKSLSGILFLNLGAENLKLIKRYKKNWLFKNCSSVWQKKVSWEGINCSGIQLGPMN